MHIKNVSEPYSWVYGYQTRIITAQRSQPIFYLPICQQGARKQRPSWIHIRSCVRIAMNCYSLLLLALTLASSFCVVVRSPFLTACRRSCSFPMISTSQNSTSVPQESRSSLTPPYSGATAAWTYPRILSFGSAYFTRGRWQPDVWENHKQPDIRISPTIASSKSTDRLLQLSVWLWMRKAGGMENLFCLMNCLPVFRSQVSRAFSE